VMSGVSFPTPDVFATVGVNSGYIATEVHYLSLASRIVAAVRGGNGFVLLTGDPPANLLAISQALNKTMESRHPVIGIQCGPELTHGALMSAASFVATLSTAGNTTAISESSDLGSPLIVFDDVDRLSRALSKPIVVPRQGPDIPREPEPAIDEGLRVASVVVALPTGCSAVAILEPSKPPSPLFVFGDVQRLSQQQLRTINEVMTGSNWVNAAGVLLARPGFLARLEEPGLRFLRERLVAEFRFQEIGQDEPVELLRRKLKNRLRSAGRGRLVHGLAGCGGLLMAGIVAFSLLQHIETIDDPTTRSTSTTASTHEISAPLPTQSQMASVAPARAVPETETSVRLQPEGVMQPAPPAIAHALPQPLAAPQGALPAAPSALSTSTEALEGGRLSSTEIVALVTRGDEVLSTGDITSARLFYERAANGGDALSALRLGATYDPTFLGRAGIRGISGDLDRASLWYLRARELDAAALRPLLKSVEPKRREEPAGTH
jgi:hypothetical protein